MRLRSIIREEELKKRGKSPTTFVMISASERKSLGMESCVVSSTELDTVRLAKAIRQVYYVSSLGLCESDLTTGLSHVSVALVPG